MVAIAVVVDYERVDNTARSRSRSRRCGRMACTAYRPNGPLMLILRCVPRPLDSSRRPDYPICVVASPLLLLVQLLNKPPVHIWMEHYGSHVNRRLINLGEGIVALGLTKLHAGTEVLLCSESVGLVVSYIGFGAYLVTHCASPLTR